jgi:hypothetical protein
MLRWYAAGLLVSLAVAWVAAVIQATVRAPVGSISVGIGLLLGVLLSTLAGLTSAQRVRSLVVGTAILAVVVVLAQHAWLYLDYRRQWHDALAKAPRFSDLPVKVPSVVEYFSRELTFAHGVLWFVDAGLIIAAAVGTMWFLLRKRREATAVSGIIP